MSIEKFLRGAIIRSDDCFKEVLTGQRQIDRSGQKPAAVHREARQPFEIALPEAGLRLGLKGLSQISRAHLLNRQVESEFGVSLLQGELIEAQIAEGTTERGLDHQAETLLHRRGPADVEPRAAGLAAGAVAAGAVAAGAQLLPLPLDIFQELGEHLQHVDRPLRFL